MQLTALLENKACREDLKAAHGLSLYIQTENHKILFDAGPNAAFAENADTLGVDLSAVDICVLSHGHYDHASGMPVFLRRNDQAKVYLRESALDEYRSEEENGNCAYIGIPRELRTAQDRLFFTGERADIDEGVTLFSLPATHDLLPPSNATLLRRTGEELERDDFRHEQNLILTEGKQRVLLAGCAHSGIVNILRTAEEIVGGELDYVFSGFHLMNPSTGRSADPALVKSVARELAKRRRTRYITCHCTGEDAFNVLSDVLGNRISLLHGGSVYFL